ncbi:MAG TPA: TIGR03862 family flavoprotein [Rhizomicrobium sp.]|jgi:hypothetical protein
MSIVAVIGGGPAGLMAAEILSAKGVAVAVYDRMPSVGRKFLMAGRGGLNLTHSEDFERFVARYRAAAPVLRPLLEDFTPARLIAWAEGLGQEIFKGSSGRMFPKAMKASPLLRAWLARLETQGVEIKTRHEWCGWDSDGALLFNANGARVAVRADAVILALGGASWPKLGSDGRWSKLLADEGAAVHPLKPSNVGFNVAWSGIFRERFAGQPIKNALFRFDGETIRGEAMVTSYGIEGGAIYALSAALRDAIAKDGKAALHIDLRPDLSQEQLSRLLAKPRGKESLSNFLRKAVKLSPLEINLLREGALDPAHLARQIKDIPITLTGIGPIARAISSAGGVGFESLDRNLMLKSKPGVFVAGEMLDWEAPTGGYLLQAAFATGVAAAKGALAWLE